jgi:hypothetical protein
LSHKEKEKKKDKKRHLKSVKVAKNCKSKCCEKYKKSEDKRCKKCPMFDLLKKHHN